MVNAPAPDTAATSYEKRRVRFAVNDSDSQQQQQQVETAKAPLALNLETCRQLWYQPDEIGTFKQDTRNLVLFGHTLAGETDMSGLERYDVERSRHKREVLRYVLMIHRMGKSAECLGSASRNSTAWASDVASKQGFHDYCAVYDPLANMISDDADFQDFLEHGDKRKAEPLSATFCGRRVRQRTMSNASAQMIRTN